MIFTIIRIVVCVIFGAAASILINRSLRSKKTDGTLLIVRDEVDGETYMTLQVNGLVQNLEQKSQVVFDVKHV